MFKQWAAIKGSLATIFQHLTPGTVDSKCFSKSYNLDDVEPGLEPNPHVYCDLPVSTKLPQHQSLSSNLSGSTTEESRKVSKHF